MSDDLNKLDENRDLEFGTEDRLKIKVNIILINIIMIPISIIVVFCLFTFSLGYLKQYEGVMVFDLLFFIPSVFISMIIHELIHAYTYIILCKGKFKDFEFGMHVFKGIAYCFLKNPIPLRKYRMITLMPFYLMTPISIILYFIFPGYTTTSILACAIFGPLFDSIYTFKLRKFPGHFLIQETKAQDHLFVIKTDEKDNKNKTKQHKINISSAGR